MGTRRQSKQPDKRLGILGWFSLLGFVSMVGLYYADVITEGNGLSPTTSLPIGIIAGIGALLFWLGNDPTSK